MTKIYGLIYVKWTNVKYLNLWCSFTCSFIVMIPRVTIDNINSHQNGRNTLTHHLKRSNNMATLTGQWSMCRPIAPENQSSPMDFAQICSRLHKKLQAEAGIPCRSLPILISRLLAYQRGFRKMKHVFWPWRPPFWPWICRSPLLPCDTVWQCHFATKRQSFHNYIRWLLAQNFTFDSLKCNQSDFLHTWQISHPTAWKKISKWLHCHW